jgi:hypothetical protein
MWGDANTVICIQDLKIFFQIWMQVDLLQTLASKPLKFWRNFLVEDYEPRNNFGYWNFPRFNFEFELKCRKAKIVLNFGD